MIARRGKRIRHSLEQIFSVVLNHRSLAVHHAVIDDHVRAEYMSDALMSKTHAKRRNVRAESADDLIGKTGFLGRTRPRRNQQPLRVERAHLVQVDLVVAMYL